MFGAILSMRGPHLLETRQVKCFDLLDPSDVAEETRMR